MDERQCKVCGDSYAATCFTGKSTACFFCVQKQQFIRFATKCGLTRYVDPSGERYIYRVDGKLDGKKSECADFFAELWNALVKAKGGDDSLLVPAE